MTHPPRPKHQYQPRMSSFDPSYHWYAFQGYTNGPFISTNVVTSASLIMKISFLLCQHIPWAMKALNVDFDDNYDCMTTSKNSQCHHLKLTHIVRLVTSLLHSTELDSWPVRLWSQQYITSSIRLRPWYLIIAVLARHSWMHVHNDL